MDRIELLSPARDASVAIAAINHGADAVYMGAPSHGARAAAGNSIEDICRVADYAHNFGVKVYVTVNTLVYDNEVSEVEQLIRRLYRAGVDALIVQDLGILRMDIPPIALHASTQCDTRDAGKAQMLERAGFSQIVLARELSVADIAAISNAVSVPLEAFVHGALCVSYSGDCRASLLTTGRSANRGECAQICRYCYDLIDGDGNTVVKNRYLLSLSDMNRSAVVEDMIRAGVQSFKIEGRLKDASYVKNVTAYYRNLLDGIFDASHGKYCRSSAGTTTLGFVPDLSRTFNRGYTDYFATSPQNAGGKALAGLKMASVLTPKSVGQKVGAVVKCTERGIRVRATEVLHNGDGLGYFSRDGRFTGFRANRVEGDMVFPASNVSPHPGAVLYRNSDKEFLDTLAGDTSQRSISVDFTLRTACKRRMVVLDAVCERGMRISVSTLCDEPLAEARSEQHGGRERTLRKTGDTIYSVGNVEDKCGNLFVPLSLLSDLRRRACETLDSAMRATYRYDLRRREDETLVTPESLSFHDNVANSLARKFYADHGTKHIEPAMECEDASNRSNHAMTSRYCLRRELGACLLDKGTRRLKEPLTLRSDSASFRLEFDCKNCLMHLYKES